MWHFVTTVIPDGSSSLVQLKLSQTRAYCPPKNLWTSADVTQGTNEPSPFYRLGYLRPWAIIPFLYALFMLLTPKKEEALFMLHLNPFVHTNSQSSVSLIVRRTLFVDSPTLDCEWVWVNGCEVYVSIVVGVIKWLWSLCVYSITH